MYALARESGSPRERFNTQGKIRSSPAVVDETVYIGSYDNNVYALGENNPTISDTISELQSNRYWRDGLAGGGVGIITGFLIGNVDNEQYTILAAILGGLGVTTLVSWSLENGVPSFVIIGLALGIICGIFLGSFLRKKGISAISSE